MSSNRETYIFQKRTDFAFCDKKEDLPCLAQISNSEVLDYIGTSDLEPDSVPITAYNEQTPKFPVCVIECGVGEEDDLKDFAEGAVSTPYHIITVGGATIVPGILMRAFSEAVSKESEETTDYLQQNEEHLFMDLWQDMDEATQDKILKKALTAYDKALVARRFPKLPRAIKEQIADMFKEIPGGLWELGIQNGLYETLMHASFPELDDQSIHTIAAVMLEGIDDTDSFNGDQIASRRGCDVMILEEDELEAVNDAFENESRVTIAYQRLVHSTDVTLQEFLDNVGSFDYEDSVDNSDVGLYVVHDSNYL